MGFGKWISDVIGKVVANLITGVLFLVALFFGVKLLMSWMGV